MAQSECVMFERPVYKDQGTPSNVGVLIAAADTVVVLVANDGSVPHAAKSITVTEVLDNGKTICWDREVTDIRSTDVKRVHRKHQYLVDDDTLVTYTIEVPKDTGSIATLTGIVINGGTQVFDCAELASSDDYEADFLACIEDTLNTILTNNGTASVTGAGTDTMTIVITATTLVPSTITGDNITPDVGGWVAS